MNKKYKHIFKRNKENKENIEKIALLDTGEDEKEIFKGEEILVFVGTQEEAEEIQFKDGKITMSIDKLKLAKREELKTVRDNSLYQPLKIYLVPYGEKKKVQVEFKVEEIDLAKFSRIKGILLTLNELGVTKEDIKGSKTILQGIGIDEATIEVIIQFLNTGAIPWVLSDNTSKMFDFKVLGMVQVAFGIREQQIFSKFIHLDGLLSKAKTVEEIKEINWE